MKNKTNILNKLVLKLFAIILVMLMFITGIQSINAVSSTTYDENFFSEANTYDAIITEKNVPGNNSKKYKSISYNLETEKRNSAVSDDDPQVTFITHGLNGTAAHWSNNGDSNNFQFQYTNDSIISLLQQKSECNIYLAKFEDSETNLLLFHLNDKDYTVSKEITNITDNTKHSIVIFEAHDSEQSNDYIYI